MYCRSIIVTERTILTVTHVYQGNWTILPWTEPTIRSILACGVPNSIIIVEEVKINSGCHDLPLAGARPFIFPFYTSIENHVLIIRSTQKKCVFRELLGIHSLSILERLVYVNHRYYTNSRIFQ